MGAASPLRVLVVDDSAVVRKLLCDALSRAADIEVVGDASDAYVARERIFQLRPDVLTLDIEMPRMDGLSFLATLMAHRPMPVIVVSSITRAGSAASVEALRLGAIDVIAKPSGTSSVAAVTAELVRRLRALRQAPGVRLAALQTACGPERVSVGPDAGAADAWTTDGLVVMGASTGGPRAVESVLSRLPANVPPILVVQHMPAGFTRAFAARLDASCAMRVVEASDGEVLRPGVASIAPGNCHLLVERLGSQVRIALRGGPPVLYQRPSVDILFHSAARVHGAGTVGVLLTGMGADGAEGLFALRKAGAVTIAQDEQSCVVFGMPRAAIAIGAATHVVPLQRMPHTIMALLHRRHRGADGPRRGIHPGRALVGTDEKNPRR